jgi:hypothetical protein
MTVRPAPWWLRFTLPIGVLATGGSLAGILVDRVYAHETSEWAGEAIGQDIANLVVFPLLLAFGRLAAKGSPKALVAWAGMLVYAAYAYAIYVFDVHFGPLFLLDVAVFGLSVWALGGALSGIDADAVAERLGAPPRTALAEGLLLLVPVMFGLLWLGEDVPAVLTGAAPEALARSGLMTNPVHVLDLSLFLPASILAGVLLRRRRAWGYVLAPVMLGAMAAISAGIVSLTIVLAVRGEDASLVVAAVIGALGAVQAFAAWKLLTSVAGERGAQPGGLPAGLGPLLVEVGAHRDAAAGAQQPGPLA